MMMNRFLAGAAISALLGSAALAQTPNITGNTFQTGQSGKTVQGIVTMCINGSNVAVPCGTGGTGQAVTITNLNPNGQAAMAASSPVVIASDQTPLQVVGNVADGVSDLGNSVKIGGLINSGFPTALTTGQRISAWFGARGNMAIFPCSQSGSNCATFLGLSVDGIANSSIGQYVQSFPALYNGSTFDRQRGNIDSAALITMTGTAAGTTNSADQTNYNGRGAQFGVNITVNTTCSAVINIQGKDAASGTYYNILSSTALVTAAFTDMTVFPGSAVTANISSSQPLPRTWRAQAVLTGASCAVTGTVGASVIN